MEKRGPGGQELPQEDVKLTCDNNTWKIDDKKKNALDCHTDPRNWKVVALYGTRGNSAIHLFSFMKGREPG